MYAEDKLSVHKVYEDVLAKRNELDSLLGELSEARDRKRDLEARRTDREVLIASEEWSKHPDMAVSRMEKHVKQAYANDDEVRDYREQLIKLTGDIEGFEFDRDILETDIRIACARLQELGGYLNFLAAIKTEAGKASEARDEGNPW